MYTPVKKKMKRKKRKMRPKLPMAGLSNKRVGVLGDFLAPAMRWSYPN
jgi:hypothetical protein